MNKFFFLFSLLSITFTVSASEEWLYYKEYPWVWDNKTEDWLYLKGGEDGKIYAYRNSTTEWEEFNVKEEEKTWDEQYEEWIQDPEPYGGLEVLEKIKEAKEGATSQLDLASSNISDISPLTGLSDLTLLRLNNNTITDISPLSGLMNLTSLSLYENRITDLTPLAGLTNLTSIALWSNNISDITPLAGLTNLTSLELGGSQITDLTPLAGLTNLTNITLSYISNSDISLLAGMPNLTRVSVPWNDINNISPLAGLTNLEKLYLSNNNITDLSPIAGLKSLLDLDLLDNPITASQKEMLEYALPSTSITWPDVIIDDILDTTPPEITILSQVGDWPSYNGGEPDFPTFSYSAIDNVDGDLTEKVEVTNRFVSGFIDGAEWGWAEVTFSVTDASGNTTIHSESGPDEPIGYTP